MAVTQGGWSRPEDWNPWSDWLAAGLHARNRWRLPVLLLGMLLASGRRTVTTWLRAAGVSDDYQDYYFFLASLGRNSKSAATRLVVLAVRKVPLPDRSNSRLEDRRTCGLRRSGHQELQDVPGDLSPDRRRYPRHDHPRR